ncbi:hypothetical protein BRD00_04380 [Halobacteriales archaeon QS_8_69_26]|nr:MAG: hypothetical protein BRD00_04380 [Halobacteriales archaeon QS_8_69_26]
MDPDYVRRQLCVRADDVHRSLLLEWGQVPDRERTVDVSGYAFPETPDDLFPWAAVALATDSDRERVLLVRHESHDYGWEPPGGKGEPDESVSETARREVREETGLMARIEELVLVERLQFDYGLPVNAPVVQAVFSARADGEPHAPPGEDAIPEVRWFHREDVPEDAQFRELILEELLS